MRPVIPCYIKFGNCLVKPCYDVLDFWDMMILLLSNFSMYHSRLYIMPEFTPNDYMLQNFGDKVSKNDEEGQKKHAEPWEIYAWCVRDAMAV